MNFAKKFLIIPTTRVLVEPTATMTTTPYSGFFVNRDVFFGKENEVIGQNKTDL